MKTILVGMAVYMFPTIQPPVIDGDIVEPPAIVQEVQCWGCYRSPYRYYHPGPGYRQQYWGIPRQGYWGPRWQRDPYWNFNRWRQGQ